MRTVWYDQAADIVHAGGITMGPKLGDGDDCDIGNSPAQVPMLVGLGGANPTLRSATAFMAANGNAQLWNVVMGSGVFVDGIYNGDLTLNGVPLPASSPCCDATFVANIGTTPWQWGMPAAPASVDVFAFDVLDGETCIAGRYDGPATLFGAAEPATAGLDLWFARLSASGVPRWVRTIGTPADDGFAVVRATPDGGCVAAFDVGAQVDLGGSIGKLPFAGGTSDVVVATLDATGMATAATALGGAGNDHVYGLVTVAGHTYMHVVFDAGLPLLGTTYTPQGADSAIIEIAGTSPSRVVALLTGTGDVLDGRLYGDGTALYVGGQFAGELVLGGITATSSGTGGYVAKLVP